MIIFAMSWSARDVFSYSYFVVQISILGVCLVHFTVAVMVIMMIVMVVSISMTVMVIMIVSMLC